MTTQTLTVTPDVLQALLHQLGLTLTVRREQGAARIERRGDSLFVGLVIPVEDTKYAGFMKRKQE